VPTRLLLQVHDNWMCPGVMPPTGARETPGRLACGFRDGRESRDIVLWLPQNEATTGLVTGVADATCRAELITASERSEPRTEPLEPMVGVPARQPSKLRIPSNRSLLWPPIPTTGLLHGHASRFCSGFWTSPGRSAGGPGSRVPATRGQAHCRIACGARPARPDCRQRGN
jgi:hypothetical protein